MRICSLLVNLHSAIIVGSSSRRVPARAACGTTNVMNRSLIITCGVILYLDSTYDFKYRLSAGSLGVNLPLSTSPILSI